MRVDVIDFGNLPNGEVGKKFVLTNKNNVVVSLLNYGATLMGVMCRDRNGKFDDILLGFDTLEGYLANPYFGSTIGRFANRLANGKFSIDGVVHEVARNNGENHLHGGVVGFDKRVWQWAVLDDGVEFTLVSEDGDEGYPGRVFTTVVYRLSDDQDELKVVFKATVSDRPTLVNLTNHAYINLTGQNSGSRSILNHEVRISATAYLPHCSLIPTGEIKPVDEAFDFTSGKKIGEHINKVEGGYDHNYCLTEGQTFCASVYDDLSGRLLEIHSSQPGLQFYSGNFLGMIGKNGNEYSPQSGFCLEPQAYPDNPNQPNFTSSVLRPGQLYEHYITWKLSTRS